jgi:hypothetical protein
LLSDADYPVATMAMDAFLKVHMHKCPPIGTYPVVQLRDVSPVNAREGQFHVISETRAGIDGSTIEAREG